MNHSALLARGDWEISPNDIVIAKEENSSLAGDSSSTGSYLHVSQSNVYKAKLGNTTEAAVKIFIDIYSAEEQAKIVREVSTLKHCRHKNVVHFYGACFMDDRVMLVTELVEGGNLLRAIQQNRSSKIFSWYQRGAKVAVDVANGLHFLHKLKIIHYDLKSASILFTRYGTAKISDVGFANTHDIATNLGCISVWVAPELLMGHNCTEKVDIYSFGVILWELATGERAERGQLRPCRTPEECPQEVDELISQCMDEIPEQRPSSGQILESLKKLQMKSLQSPSATSATTVPMERASGTLRDLARRHRMPADGMQSGTAGAGRTAARPSLFPPSVGSGSGSGDLRRNFQELSLKNWLIRPKDIALAKGISGAPLKLGPTVFKAIIYGNTPVAVKKLKDIADKAEEEDAMKELATLMECRHRNIVELLGASFSDKKVMIVTELMEGGDLFRALEEHHASGEFSWYRRGGQVAIDIAHGLQFLHSRKITHFDLRSPCILLKKDGVAKISGMSFANGHITSKFGFTFAWTAPEILLGTPCTEKVDIYSYGIILWELATGEKPKRNKIRECKVPNECPAEVKQLIQRCLSFPPETRPSCEAILKVLNGLQFQRAPSFSFDVVPQPNNDPDSMPARPSTPGVDPTTPSPRHTSPRPGAVSPSRPPPMETNIRNQEVTGRSIMSLPELSWSNWQIEANEIVISKDAFGSPVVLGSGTNGTVYKATIDDVSEVAVKMYHDPVTPKEQSKILREVATLKSCSHSNIVQFYGASVVDDRICLVTELMEGGDLHYALEHDTGKFSWYKRGWRVAMDIVCGLHFLHKRSVTHFDLKSPNILLRSDGSAKISDVGFANTQATTSTGFSFHWAAPELLLGDRHACTSKVDIYSYGVILWELVTGQTPQRGKLRDCRVPQECPLEVSQLIQQCMSPMPENRPDCKRIVEILNRCRYP